MFQEISLASKSTNVLTTTAHVRRSAFVEPTKHKSERNAKGQTSSVMIWGTRRVGRRRDICRISKQTHNVKTTTTTATKKMESRRATSDQSFVDNFMNLFAMKRATGEDEEIKFEEIRPGQGRLAPKFPEICAYLKRSNRCKGISAEEFKRAHYDEIARRKQEERTDCVNVYIDIRQPLEYGDWRVYPFVSCAYQTPSKNAFRRISGYALSIKGGLKERDEDFVKNCFAIARAKRGNNNKKSNSKINVFVCDLKGGSINTSQSSETSNMGVIDASDSFAIRACYELVQAGFANSVQYVEGGFPALIDEVKIPYQSEKFEKLLSRQSESNRKLLMYAKLLPDVTILPGVLIQASVFLLFALSFYNVGGIGDILSERVPAACSFLPIKSCFLSS
jgi:hypothetical protein